ncbi:MAG: 3-isopropylmalate dehydratase small subunit [Gammaproteobacteria bacterium]|nr:3-isopropylmalate dehydratase small subunit [Gammaproteobacteria bacterium]
MERFETLEGVVAPIDRANVDTDAIIPKQFLKSIKRSGFGPNLFDEWRYLDRGEPDVDNSTRPVNPDFVLNQPRFRNARILVVRENFGCGSSREHAVWALEDFGIRAVIGSSFADIFYNNCFKNGVLPIVLDAAQVAGIFDLVAKHDGLTLKIDLPEQVIELPDGGRIEFSIEPFRKECLLKGLDEIGLTLAHADEIKAYEARRREQAPWLFAAGEK